MRLPILVVLSLLAISTLAHPAAALQLDGWALTGSMHLPHSHDVAVRLLDGRVLVVGGRSQSGHASIVTASAEIYDPRTATWADVPAMSVPRADSAAALLADGRVLVSGGSDGTHALASAEIFDPHAASWSPASSMRMARGGHTATRLEDGRVLVVGGFGDAGPLATTEIYDPGTGMWRFSEDMRDARGNHAATLTSDGNVLVTGGFGRTGATNTVELYDAHSDRWVGALPLPAMLTPRYAHTATLLFDGRILVTGGIVGSSSLASAEIYDPESGTWTPVPQMNLSRAWHTATVLSDGRVLVTGGEVLSGGGTSSTNSAELFDPRSTTWSLAGGMSTARFAHTATPLAGGQVLIAGGSNGAGDLQSAELFTVHRIDTPMSSPVVTTSLPTFTMTKTPTAIPTRISATATARSQLVPTATAIVPTPTSPAPQSTVVPTVPTHFAFYIRGVKVERDSDRPDWRLVRPPVIQVVVGTQVRLSLYASFTSVPHKTHIIFASEVQRAGRTIFQTGITEDRVGPGDVWDHWTFTPKLPGKYIFTGHVTAGGRTEDATTSFVAVTQKHPLLFSFDRLQTRTDRGLPSQTFRRRDRVIIAITITVHHATRALSVRVGQSLQFASHAHWKTLGRTVQTTFYAVNGTHLYTVSFFPQTPHRRLRMVVDVMIASRTMERSVAFTVHR